MAKKSGHLVQIFRSTVVVGITVGVLGVCGDAMGQVAVNDNTQGNDKRGYAPELVVPGAWRPVDQTVSDYSPNATSQRRLNHGNSLFSRNVTLYERDALGDRLQRGLPTVDLRTGMHVPTQYQYRAPGVTALVQRPEYLVVVGKSSKRTYVKKNRQPVRDGLFADVGSAGMVYNLNINLLNPVIEAQEESKNSPQAAYVPQAHYVSGWEPATSQTSPVPSVGARLDMRVNGGYEVHRMSPTGGHTGSYFDPTVDGRFYNPARATPREE